VVDDQLEVHRHWRISTQTPRTIDEMSLLLVGLLREGGIDPAQLQRGVLGSVVPARGAVLFQTLGRIVPGEVYVVGTHADHRLSVRLDVDEPRTVGADRIVNTLAARVLFGRDTIVVDLGTATTYDCITADGVFVGGVIAPGVSSGLDWLSRRAAKLPEVSFTPPERVVGRRTESCMQSGVFFGVVDAVEGMLARIREEWGRPEAWVVATGGYAEVVAPHAPSVDHVAPHLTLKGLALAGIELSRD
jgi:type III pantothenate kinase